MPEDIPIEERASKRLRSTVQLLYALALLKLFAVMLAPQVMAGRNPGPAIAWFASGLAITLTLAHFLGRGIRWARTAVFVWSGIHVVGLFFFAVLGAVAVLEGMLGAMIAVTLLIASGLGAFDR